MAKGFASKQKQQTFALKTSQSRAGTIPHSSAFQLLHSEAEGAWLREACTHRHEACLHARRPGGKAQPDGCLLPEPSQEGILAKGWGRSQPPPFHSPPLTSLTLPFGDI